MREIGDNLLWAIIIIAFAAIMIAFALAGCTDNRIRIKQPLDIRLSAEKEAELRLYVLRNLWEQDALKRAELYYIERKGE